MIRNSPELAELKQTTSHAAAHEAVSRLLDSHLFTVLRICCGQMILSTPCSRLSIVPNKNRDLRLRGLSSALRVPARLSRKRWQPDGYP